MASKKAPVAGSVQGPAIIQPAENAELPKVESAVAEVHPFPREVVVINETPMNYSVARAMIGAGEQVKVMVRDDDEITRIKTDCGHIMGLTPAYAALEVQPLRVIDAAAE